MNRQPLVIISSLRLSRLVDSFFMESIRCRTSNLAQLAYATKRKKKKEADPLTSRIFFAIDTTYLSVEGLPCRNGWPSDTENALGVVITPKVPCIRQVALSKFPLRLGCLQQLSHTLLEKGFAS